MSVPVQIVAPPVEPRLARHGVQFDVEAATQLGLTALRTKEWQYYCEHGSTLHLISENRIHYPEIEVVVAVAAPDDGATAVWYGRANSRSLLMVDIARAAVPAHDIREIWRRPDGITVSTQAPLGQASARILHAAVFGRPANPRDQLLVEYLHAPSPPPTEALLAASIEVLEAASALRQVGRVRQANRLVRQVLRGKLVDQTT
jgi:hypothetical protein